MTKFPIKTAAIGAVVALGIGATSATAGSLITSAKIKDGSVHMRDLSPGVKAKLTAATASIAKKKQGPPGPAGTNGTNGTNGVDGLNGANGIDGKPGVDGEPGRDGKDADLYDRIVGSCDSDPYAQVGEVSIHDGVAALGVPTQMAWAQVKTFPKNLKVSDIENLSFTANASDVGQSYLKVSTTGHGSILFDASSQEGGETIGEPVEYRVNGEGSTVRWNDDKGMTGQKTWTQALSMAANRHVKSISITAGCALGDEGMTLVDDLTINEDVIDFA